MMHWIPIALVVLGGVAYHLGQKQIPAAAHPLVAALGMYGIAALACLLLLPVASPAPSRATATASLHWSVALVGVGIVGIEVGFLLAYRAGWELSSASVTVTSLVALVLVPLGVVLFREAWSLSRLLGFVLCVAGLWLVQRP